MASTPCNRPRRYGSACTYAYGFVGPYVTALNLHRLTYLESVREILSPIPHGRAFVNKPPTVLRVVCNSV